MRILLYAIAIAAAANAQSNPGAVGGPVLGAVFDPTVNGLRWLKGIPASAMLGDLLDQGPALEAAAVSAGLYAVATEAATGTAVLISSAGRTPLPGVPSGASRITLSPRGTAAVLYSKDDRTASLIAGLPDAPRLLSSIRVGAPSVGFAISDDGASLVTIEPAAKYRAALLYRTGQPPVVLHKSHDLVAAEFIPGTSDILIAEDHAVLLVSDSFGPQPIAGETDGLADVVSATASSDGGRVIIAMRSGRVIVRDRQSNAQVTLTCPCQPSSLTRLRGGAVFRLNEIGDAPLWLLDADATAPRIVFVAGERQ